MLHHFTEERRQALATARPEQAVVLAYDQAIECLHKAISAIARKAIAERCNATTAAIEILSEMVQCLELEALDDIGFNIARIHRFIIARLPQVNLYNDAKFAAESVRMLSELRDAFAVVDRQNKAVQEAQADMPRIPQPTPGKARLSLVPPVA